MELKKYIAAKGSVCLEGISLTVNEVRGNEFGVNIIPHTAEKTTLGIAGWHKVNLEVDIFSRYLESLIKGMAEENSDGLTLDKLVSSGFANQSR